jgi:hypothetical protein
MEYRLGHAIHDFLQNELHVSGIYLVIGVMFALGVLWALLGPSKGSPSSEPLMDRASRLSHTWQWITLISLGLMVIAVFAALRWLSGS